MAKRAWFLSLLLPVLSIIGSMIFVVIYLVNGGFPVFIGILGLVGSGIVPIVLIIRNRLDMSKYFPVKIILFSVLGVAVMLSWADLISSWFDNGYNLFIPAGVVLVAEIVFAALQKTDRKTKICLALSSVAWSYLGFVLEMIVGLALF